MQNNNKSLVSSSQLTSTSELEEYFVIADKLQNQLKKSLRDKIIACVFYEPSTRTRFSFEAAAIKLGAQVISSENAKVSSSSSKGESIEDTIRVMNNYADAIVMRHFENGICAKAAKISSVPIINAGDGSNEHPTQAILDVYSIKKRFGKVDGLRVALVGDLLYGRTVHSLVFLLSLYKDIKLNFISPAKLKMPPEFKKILQERAIDFVEQEDLIDLLPEIDVLYMTRIQRERFGSEEEYLRFANSYCIDKASVDLMKQDAIIMHPLPRVNEISPDIDDDKRAYYFQQAKNGLYIRMAVLQKAITDKTQTTAY